MQKMDLTDGLVLLRELLTEHPPAKLEVFGIRSTLPVPESLTALTMLAIGPWGGEPWLWFGDGVHVVDVNFIGGAMRSATERPILNGSVWNLAGLQVEPSLEHDRSAVRLALGVVQAHLVGLQSERWAARAGVPVVGKAVALEPRP